MGAARWKENCRVTAPPPTKFPYCMCDICCCTVVICCIKPWPNATTCDGKEESDDSEPRCITEPRFGDLILVVNRNCCKATSLKGDFAGATAANTASYTSRFFERRSSGVLGQIGMKCSGGCMSLFFCLRACLTVLINVILCSTAMPMHRSKPSD